MGCLSGLAQGVPATWQALLDGRDATRPFRRALGEANHLVVEGVAVPMNPPDHAAFGARYNSQALAQMDDTAAYAVLAAFEALDHAGLLDRPDIVRRAGVIFGCGAGGLATIEHFYQRLYVQAARSFHPLTIPRQMPSAPASQISMLFGTQGVSFGIASACASSAHAIAEAATMIRSGRLDIAIAGGTEAPLTLGSWQSWRALKVVARERCRPFSAGRDGMVLGEGSAALILESEDHALARGATPQAELLGSGASSDAHHMTQPDGAGVTAALQAALADAGLARDVPVLISSHGTGTILNDRSEAAALRAVFGEALDHSMVLATKSSHGHLCGAGGAIELLIGILALQHGIAPPVLHYFGRDADCDLPLPLHAPQPMPHKILVSNSFAFGGMNAVLVATAVPR